MFDISKYNYHKTKAQQFEEECLEMYWFIIWVIEDNKSLSKCKLAELLEVTPPSVTNIVNNKRLLTTAFFLLSTFFKAYIDCTKNNVKDTLNYYSIELSKAKWMSDSYINSIVPFAMADGKLYLAPYGDIYED